MPANNLTIRQDLAEYAFAVFQDNEALLSVADILAPRVPTGAASGQFNKFDTTNAFKVYNAQRAVGGRSTAIELLSTQATFSAKPNGLRISIDKHERDQAGGDGSPGIALLEQSKTRTLLINSALSHAATVVATVKDGLTAVAGVGNWSNAAKDPIVELDNQIVAMWEAIGAVPNELVMDFGAWVKMRNNPNVIKRMPGAEIAALSTDKLASLLCVPLRITINTGSELKDGGLGNASATRKGLLAGSAILLASSTSPTQYDPSAAKTFTPRTEMFSSVQMYEELPNLTWFETDWTADVQIVSAAMARLIDVT